MSRVQLAVLGERVASASLTTIQSQRRKKKKKRSHTGLASLYTQGREHVSSLRGSGASRRTDHCERAASALRATVTYNILNYFINTWKSFYSIVLIKLISLKYYF